MQKVMMLSEKAQRSLWTFFPGRSSKVEIDIIDRDSSYLQFIRDMQACVRKYD